MSKLRILQTLLVAVALSAGVLAAPSAGSANHVRPPTETCRTESLPGNPPPGWFYCDYGVRAYIWPDDGHLTYFVVGGEDYRVYTSRRLNGTWNSWRSLGGQARSGVAIHSAAADGSRLVISVIGTTPNHTRYCNPWTESNGWGGWRPCSQL
jgi:hypothetical protein